MQVEDAYLIGHPPGAFRIGTPGRIIGVKFVKYTLTDINPTWRPCYQIEFGDGFIKNIPISDVDGNKYSIICNGKCD